MDLGTAPSAPVSDGDIAFGTYRGSCSSTAIDLDVRFRLGRFVRLRHEKKLQQFWAVDDALALYGSVVDAGPIGMASLWVFDRADGTVLADSTSILPPLVVRIDDDPTADPVAVARFLDHRVTLDNRGDTTRGSGRMETTKFTVGYDTPAAEPVTAVRPATDGEDSSRHVVISQQSASLPVTGWLNADGHRHRFSENAVGMLDYTHGLVPATMTWHGAIASGHAADGTAVGFSIGTDPEGVGNVVWIDGVPRGIGPTTIVPEEWRIETEDGYLSVSLDVEYPHRRTISFGPISHRIVQPFGRWRGTLGDRTIELPGVGELHEANW
ncbi:DUF2804 family protein [Halocatena salina]|uniref:DUF2804 domain-containing protein n=1 Tax=Halocatena salina TaxID=2934340 RepID=A0A8U0A4T2_9EURY|nr:DUF2804 family protein [Halocatena salina]UPM44044.1 DUF2804 domain-containing protein [Halocatena salina]